MKYQYYILVKKAKTPFGTFNPGDIVDLTEDEVEAFGDAIEKLDKYTSDRFKKLYEQTPKILEK